MDKRLEQGRELIQAGEESIRVGAADAARQQFLDALMLFRGPELRLGEAHSLRGLARIDLALGQAERSEMQVREAISVYARVRELIERIDDEATVAGFRHDADEGEAVAYVLLGEVLVELGQHGNARVAFQKAKRIFATIGDVSSSAVMWASMGRLAMRDGQYDEAETYLTKALNSYVQTVDLANQANVLLSMAELSRLRQNFDGAESNLTRVTELARSLDDQQLEGRAVSALGALHLQLLDLEGSQRHYLQALNLAEKCSDHKMASYSYIGLGEVQSRAGSNEALVSIVKGAQGFASLGHEHGMGAAMLRLAEHGMRSGRPLLGLVSAESARRLWRRSDPVRGVGQALRIVVKALAAMKRWEAVVTVAKARLVVAGELQPNAHEVFEFYADKAPVAWLEKLAQFNEKELLHHAEGEIEAAINALVLSSVVKPADLGTILGSMSTIERLLTEERDGAGHDQVDASAENSIEEENA